MTVRPAVFACCALPALLVFFSAASAAQQPPASQPALWAAKPDIKAFEAIEDHHLAAAQQSLDRILAVKGPRTIENTLRPFDEALRQLNSASYFAGLMQQVNPDTAFRDHATVMTSKAGAAQTALSLNRPIYKALSSLDISHTDPATRYYLQRQLLEFRLAGVDKDDATRQRLRDLSEDLIKQQSMFDRNIADGRKTVAVTDRSELAGLPKDYLDRHQPDAHGAIQISTDYPDFLSRHEVRQKQRAPAASLRGLHHPRLSKEWRGPAQDDGRSLRHRDPQRI